MMNMRSGRVDFVTYDSKLASDLFLHGNTNYIVLEEGGIYPAINKVLKDLLRYLAGLSMNCIWYHLKPLNQFSV